ncbi:hypothetical protein J6590_014118 [Homalodisca vitripennis]|nr:hypothetical protein J6590_014118 [Homalodisca vitripennis]
MTLLKATLVNTGRGPSRRLALHFRVATQTVPDSGCHRRISAFVHISDWPCSWSSDAGDPRFRLSLFGGSVTLFTSVTESAHGTAMQSIPDSGCHCLVDQ